MNSPGSARLLQNFILYATKTETAEGVTNDPFVECAHYPAAGKLAMINNSPKIRKASCVINKNPYTDELEPFALKILDL